MGKSPLRDDGLVVSRHDLSTEIGYINAHNIMYIDIFTDDPRMIVDRAFREARLQELQSAGIPQTSADHLTNIAPLRNCPQLTQLSLCGDLTGSEVLAELPNLRCLSLDNTLGKHKVDLSPLALHTLFIQKPGRNVYGYEQIISLRELCIWNYQPRSRNLSELAALTNLQHLRLIRPRIDTLDGVEDLLSLSQLEVTYSSSLTDITALARCCHPITVRMDHVPNAASL